MAFAKFRVNRFRIDGEITENHAILVILTASNVVVSACIYVVRKICPPLRYGLERSMYLKR